MSKKVIKIETQHVVLLAASLIIGASILGYAYLDYKSKQEALTQKIMSEEFERAAKEKEKEDNLFQYNLCVGRARVKADDWWKRSCEGLGLDEECSLPSYNADTINESREKWVDDCYRLYFQN